MTATGLGPPLDSRRLRLAAVHADGRFNALVGLEVDDGGTPSVPPARTLLVSCERPVPAGLSAGAVAVLGGVRVDPALNPVRVLWALPASELVAAHRSRPEEVSAADVEAFAGRPGPDRLLVVRTSSAGDFSTYRLTVTDPERYGFDPALSQLPFSFKVDCPAEFDPRPPAPVVPAGAAPPPGDYLDRDYGGLRRLLLDRVSLLLPGWSDRNPADLGVTLLELFAVVGDQLAYAQDAVATEAYLGTARRRVSVRRHARLLDYRMHDGTAARAWLTLSVTPAADGVVLPAGAEVRTESDDTPPVVFRTLHPATARFARTAVEFYTWGDERAVLAAGSTGATFSASAAALDLVAGDVLLLEEVLGPDGRPGTADPTRRHPVRLVADPEPVSDPLTGAGLVGVRWHQRDATPFPLRLWQYPTATGTTGAAVARGNVVLAEHGSLVGPEPLVPGTVPGDDRFRPRLSRIGLTYAVGYDHRAASGRPAAEALGTDPADAAPALVEVHDDATTWTAVADLLAASRFAADFVVETDDEGYSRLRFGDGRNGRRPAAGTRFTATYRVGGGSLGNVGRESLIRLAEPVPGVAVRNPLPALGGIDPEPVEQARQRAPEAFRVIERAVTDDDYAALAARRPEVHEAVAFRRWTGAWSTEVVAVQPADGVPMTGDRLAELADYLDGYRMAGGDLQVGVAVGVSLDIVLTVHVSPGRLAADVRRDLADRFTAGLRADGAPGFFHPSRLAFGAPVYLSQVLATAMSVVGVAWVGDRADGTSRFQRWGCPPAGEWAAGRIPMGPREIARCLSDPSLPEHGRIDFRTEEP